MSAWECHFDSQNRIWTWRLEIPNGWTATVTDDSTFGVPERPTQYLASAISRTRIVQAKEHCFNIAAAKREALELALAQEIVEA